MRLPKKGRKRMKSLDYPQPVQDLIASLKKLPGIGSRGAERLALWLLQGGRSTGRELSSALVAAADSAGRCPECGFFSMEGQRCAACADPERDRRMFCVVEQPTDVLPVERCGVYRGLYHCLGGKLSPLDGTMPEDLSVEPLLRRVHETPGCEVILAMGSDVEGEATALYLAEALALLPCTVTRLAQGMPAGAGLGHADAVTLMRAMEGRKGVL